MLGCSGSGCGFCFLFLDFLSCLGDVLALALGVFFWSGYGLGDSFCSRSGLGFRVWFRSCIFFFVVWRCLFCFVDGGMAVALAILFSHEGEGVSYPNVSQSITLCMYC